MTEENKTTRVYLINKNIGTHHNRPESTITITANEFIVNSKNEKERFSRDSHKLIKPEI